MLQALVTQRLPLVAAQAYAFGLPLQAQLEVQRLLLHSHALIFHYLLRGEASALRFAFHQEVTQDFSGLPSSTVAHATRVLPSRLPFDS